MAQAGQAMAQTAGNMPAQGSSGGGSGPAAFFDQYIGQRALRQIGLIAGLAAAIAAGIGLFMWANEPVYRQLYAELGQEDASAVMDALQGAGIDYRLDQSTGAIMVPADAVHRARLQLAGDGLPSGGAVGFESLRQEQGFGTSQFMETARFHRALETELARTVGTLDAVRAARVHLAIPRQSVFVRDRNEPRASVVLNLHAGRNLGDGQVAAIVNMVAGSVTELDPKRVSVVDQSGRLLSANDGEASGAMEGDARQLEFRRRIETDYARRIEALLAPIIGSDRVRAQVNADVDFSSAEATEEIYDPDGRALVSEQSSSERRTAGEQAQGVPGALANQPPEGGQVNVGNANNAEANANAGDGQGQQQNEPVDVSESATRNYEVSRTVRHVRNPMGEIERLTVAVLLDAQRSTNADGEPVVEPLPQETIEQVRALVSDAVGLNQERGDSLNVVSTPFQPAEDMEPVETPVWEQPWVWEVGKLALASVLGLVLILAVVRPLVYGLLGRTTVRREESAGAQGGAEQPGQIEDGQGGTPQLTGPQADQARQQMPSAESYQDQVSAAREIAQQEPALAANVVKNWLNNDD
ncbi:flagellar M-ring protein FliF [Ectothiorhodospiraceae bacterium WFHF3C12]|nr:flagellar M-ring protein FliF [Ectothiorhodospiraceae bacterium WFHF3C12]